MTSLLPGHHLYAAADGSWRHSAPGDRFSRISGPAATLHAFQELAHGRATPTLEQAESAELGQLRELFRGRDLLQVDRTPAAAGSAGADRPLVLVQGDSPVARMVADLLREWCRVLTDPVDGDAVAPPDAIISCAGWLPDDRWLQLDHHCREQGIPWHRCHAEGDRFYLGPLTTPRNPVGYRDVRGRRLAASPVAEELLEQWRYLQDPAQPKPPVPWPSGGGVAVLAGLLTQDLWQHFNADPAAQLATQCAVQVEVDPAGGAVIGHPVLPLPVTAHL